MPVKPQLIDESNDRKYFTIVPNYIVNHSTIWEQGVYLMMKRIAGEEGQCFASQKEIASRLKISQPTVARTITKLVKRGWIKQDGFHPGKTRPVKCWRIVDLWELNADYYKDQKICKPQNQSSEKIVQPQNISPQKVKDSATTEYKIDKPQNKEEYILEEDILPTIVGNTKPSFGNQDINLLTSYLKEKLQLPMLDGTDKTNRQYCWLALKKFGGVEKMKVLIDTASQDKFWATKITSFQQLYYKGVQIISDTRGGKYGEYITR